MPVYSGSFQYLDERGASLNQGPCQLSFDQETCIVTPGSGAALAFDLGDVDAVTSGDWDMRLALFTGRVIELRKFGAAFGRMRDEVVAAWRDRTVRCLLLEDLEEVARYNGTAALNAAAPAPAEIRLYKTNLAILPAAGLPMQWRLAEVDSVGFDDASYSMVLQSGAERLAIAKLAKKTDEFRGRLGEALDALHTQSAGVLHQVFPFLNPDQLRRLLALMPEGRSVRLGALPAIHPKLAAALVEEAVDARLKPYFEALRGRADGNAVMAGFKFIRPDEPAPDNEGEASAEEAAAEGAPAESAQDPGGEEAQAQPLFFWFFLPIMGAGTKGSANIVAWEACTGTGRATYFFRLPPEGSVEAAVTHLTRGLALVNFRREPVYLPDDSLECQPRYHRYAIGCRKLPDLRAPRAAFIGRAMHSSIEAWTAQVESVLKPAGA